MIVRIVRMSFRPEEVDSFLRLFETIKERIKSFSGCKSLELYKDIKEPHVLITYSYWESEQDLDSYRTSAFFAETWLKTKSMFAQRPVAFSMESVNAYAEKIS